MQLYLEEQVKFYETVKVFLLTIYHIKLESVLFVALLPGADTKPSHDHLLLLHSCEFFFLWIYRLLRNWDKRTVSSLQCESNGLQSRTTRQEELNQLYIQNILAYSAFFSLPLI